MKNPPPATFGQLRPPNNNYTYFEDKNALPFRDKASAFDKVNSGWLADFAMLAYGSEKFIQDHLDASGLSADGFQMKFFSINTTQCFVVHNDKFVVLSFRGTEMDNFYGAITDWALDLEFALVPDQSGGLVHDGFQDGINDIWPELKQYLQPLLSDRTGRTLWITGHSLGAALATLGAERAKNEANFDVRGVYPYGSPRVGDGAFAQHYAQLGLNEITYRFVYDVDVVPKVPPPILYTHVGKLKYFDSAGHLHELESGAEAGLEPHLPSNTRSWLHQLSFLGHAGISFLANPFKIIIPAPLADHAPIYYACYAWNSV